MLGGYTANLTQVGEKIGSLIVGKRVPPDQPFHSNPMPVSTLNILSSTLEVALGPDYSYIFPTNFHVGNNADGLVNQFGGVVSVEGDLRIGTGISDPAVGTYHMRGGSITAFEIRMGRYDQPGVFIVAGDTNDISGIDAQILMQYPTSTLSFILGETGTPGLSVAESVTLDGQLMLDLDELGASLDSIVLISNAGTSPLTTSFANAAEETLYSSNQGIYALTYRFDAQGDALYNDVAIMHVPLPSALWVLMPGLVALTLRPTIHRAP